MEVLDAVFLVAIIMFSAVIHELMHGVAANKLGDPTARLLGRLTLNPIPHLDAFGSIILPIVLVYTHSSILFGWAKPVPYNPFNLRPGRFSEAIVAAAGPLSNLAIALFFAIVARFLPLTDLVKEQIMIATASGRGLEVASSSVETFFAIAFLTVFVNIMLFVFNLIPVPPLDGSKVFSAILPKSAAIVYKGWRDRMERNVFMGMGIVLVIILLLGNAFGSLVYAVAHLIAGV